MRINDDMIIYDLDEPVAEEQVYGNDTVDDIVTINGTAFTNALIEEMLADIKRPLSEKIKARKNPQHTKSTETTGFNLGETGVNANTNGELHLGGYGARICIMHPSAIIAMWSSEVQLHAHLKIFSNEPHRTLDINTGPLNASFIPPVTVLQRDVPAMAVVSVKTDSTRNINKARPSIIIDQKSPLDMDKDGIHVVIPEHTHATPSGPSGTAIWTGTPSISPVVRGVEYQYIFGRNRTATILKENTKRIYKQIADGVR